MADFSREATAQILAVNPDGAPFAREEPGDDGDPCSVIRIPNPVEADVDHVPTINTDNAEVTVSFVYSHAHFNEGPTDESAYGTPEAIALLGRIVSERVAAASWWLGSEWRGSRLLKVGEEPDFDRIGVFGRIRVRSWRGTRNADIVP